MYFQALCKNLVRRWSALVNVAQTLYQGGRNAAHGKSNCRWAKSSKRRKTSQAGGDPTKANSRVIGKIGLIRLSRARVPSIVIAHALNMDANGS